MKNVLQNSIIGALFICSVSVSAAPTPWNGSADVSWYESSAQAYNLINAEQLAGLAKLVNDGTCDFAGKTITLGADIFLNDTTGADAGSWYNASHRSWTPIGTTSRPFKGEFDGIAGKKNRKIYGLYINSSSTNYAGLFGYTSNVKISNLDVLVGKVVAKDNVGSLIGYAEGGSVTNVHAEVRVNGINRVGGLVGYFTGSISKSSTKGAVLGQDSVGGLIGITTGSITGTTTTKSFFIGNVEGDKYVGGIVGSGVSISNSYSEASVKGASHYVGGLAGFITGKIQSSYHIKGLVSGNGYVGGLVGSILDIVEDSYSESDVIGKENYVGGLIGLSNYTKNATTRVYTLNNSHVVGDVRGNNFVGGLIGSDSTSGRMDRAVVNCYSIGRVEGNSYVGGLLGKTDYLYSVNGSNPTHFIESSYHKGEFVIGTSNYIGGLVGETYGHIIDSYNVGDVRGVSYVGGIVGSSNVSEDSVSNSHFVGNVLGQSYVGGIIGSGVKISNSYAEGHVKGASGYVGGVAGYARIVDKCFHIRGEVEGNAYVGGLAGSVSDSIKSSYSEGNVSGSANYVGGLVGFANKIKSSYHENGNISGNSYIGGLAGSVSNSVMETFHSNGNVTGLGAYVGGLIGRAEGLIVSSYHEKGYVEGMNYVGGLAGQIKLSVDNSYSKGNVLGFGDYIGGLAGQIYRSANTTGKTSKDSTYIFFSYSIGDVKGKNYVGGLIGQDFIYKELSRNKKNDINNSTQVKQVIENSYSKGFVEGLGYVGGLIGAQIANSDSSNKYISEKYISFKVISCNHSEGSVSAIDDYAGGLIGYSVGIIDLSSHIDGDIFGSSFVGGLAGYTVSDIENSYSEGNINGTENNVGGIVGYAGNRVKDSYSKGDVFGVDSIGGLAGYVGLSIRNSYAKGSFVKGRNTIGGLVGLVDGSIDASYFEGDSVTGIYQVGGLAGYAAKAVDSSYSTANVKGDDNVGGLIGSAYGDVSNSYAIGNITGDIEHSSAGNDNLGGLVGYQYGGSVSKSMAIGNVYGTTKLGGLVGRFEGTSISQSYANGDVTGDYYGDPADEVGNYYIGGLVGYAKGIVDESYASGVVKGIEDGPVYTGCIVGYVSRSLSVTKSYYDKTKCNLGIDGGEDVASVMGNPAKTTEEMQTQSTFVDWDFTNTWRIEKNIYPFLQIYANSLTNAIVSTESLEGFEYDGLPKTPQVTTVTLFGGVLTENTDYTVKYEKNVNAGTAKISVCGLNLYGGCKNIEFEIAPKAIEPTISSIEDVVYTGLAMIPEISVYNGKNLLSSTDYTVEYKDNINAGTATIIVTMKENYSGSAVKSFKINKADPIIIQNPSASDITVGESLALSNLTNGKANVLGVFSWKSPKTMPSLDNTGYTVVFTPSDETNYSTVEIVVPIKVWDVAYVVVHIGKETFDSVSVIKGTNYTLPVIPDSVGYDFVGFYKGNSLIGFSGDEISVNENTVLDAKYSVKIFAVNFVDDGIELQSDNLPYGSLPQYMGPTPIRAATAKYTYAFKGWSPVIEPVSKSATYTAVFDSVVNKYVVTFMDGRKELQSIEVAYGAVPTAPVVTPPPNTARYEYWFKRWNPAISEVTEDVEYVAEYDSTLRFYYVSFVNGAIGLQSNNLSYGSWPRYTGNTPVKTSTAKYTYTFKGWNPTISSVTGDAIYTAIFDSTLRKYAIIFKNGTTTLQMSDVTYGTKPSYTGSTPIKSATDKYTFTFKDWSPSIESVIGTATYTAVFDSTLRNYTITFKNGTTTLQTDDVAYGVKPVYTGDTPAKTSTDKYSYSFKDWSPAITSVTGVATYIAVFDSTLREYAVTFKNGTTTLQTSEVAYGVKPSYTGITPTKVSTDKYSYTFKCWSPAITSVTGAATYTAVFDSTLRGYVVTFKNGTMTLQTSDVAYGTKPSYAGSTPTKTSTDKYSYTFMGWNPTITSVTGAATYTAVFDSTLRKYTITFKNGTTTLQTSDVAYGTKPSYTGSTPTKKATNKYTYKFKGWNPAVAAVTKAATYQAVFDSTKVTGIVEGRLASLGLSMRAVSRSIQISAAPKNSTYAVLDMQGRVLLSGRVESANFNIAVPNAGSYLVRVGNVTRKVQVK